jgi:hypothetical protein
MKKSLQNKNGSTLIYALLTLLILSLIGANVLLNSTTRYNVSSKQVKAWKEALYAAEGGADVAFAEVRKLVSSPTTAFSGWTSPASSPAPTPGLSYGKGPITFGQNNSLSATVTVDSFASTNGVNCYRIRSAGTARLFGLARVGMDDRVNITTKGDSLVRKIDFNYDHFLAKYGDGDGNGANIQTVPNPQITRRIETVAVPQWPFSAAIKATASFNGPGSAGVVDSYDSKNGIYNPLAASNPLDPHYSDARSGDVSVATSSFSEGGPIYGNVTTNGGNVTHSSNPLISGTIDNSVPFTIPPVVEPDTTGYSTGSGSTLNVPTGTSPSNPAKYVYSSSLSDGFTINGQNVASGLPNAGNPAETYVTIVVNGDVSNITIAKGVNAKIYFTGDLSIKASKTNNNNIDGATGVYNANGSPSTDYSRPGHLQFYGISPTDGSTNEVKIQPGDLYATIYAPNSDFSMIGNAQVFGAIVVHIFNGNGITGLHYDKELAALGIAVGYQVASYIEDIR